MTAHLITRRPGSRLPTLARIARTHGAAVEQSNGKTFLVLSDYLQPECAKANAQNLYRALRAAAQIT